MANASPSPSTITKPIYVRVTDVPLVFGFSKRHLYRLVEQGKITLRKFGGMSLVKVTEVEDLIEGKE